MLKLYNTLAHKKEEFRSIKPGFVEMYACGPTVYDYAHLGNLRSYLFEDVLKRVLEFNGLRVKHVLNITDVGHLTENGEGEDKIEKRAARDKKDAWELAKFYTKAFLRDLKALNIKMPDVLVRATDTIEEQIALVKLLEQKGFAYVIKDGVYFDTAKLKGYGRLWPAKMELEAGSRVKVAKGKKNPADFALWKLTPVGVKRQMEWDSPWGRGWPGWHTECVVMSVKNLGLPFDIHCGGIDHILVHHTNEIAQSEAAYGKNLANFWLHNDFLELKEGKMAKSQQNIITLGTVVEKKIPPLAYRYLILMAHYRTKIEFSWESLGAAENALKNLYTRFLDLEETNQGRNDNRIESWHKRFRDAIDNDLDTPKALSLAWEILKDATLTNGEKRYLLLDFDRVFGLGLAELKSAAIPAKIRELADLRTKYRAEKKWQAADKLRAEIEQRGWQVEDADMGTRVKKID